MAYSRDITPDSHSFQDIMNAVSVKISELYRPPRKVTVSSGVLQRKNHDDFSSLYNFSLEESIANKMHQMKQFRVESKQTQKKHLANYHQSIQIEQFSSMNKTGPKNEEKTDSIEDLDRESDDPVEESSPHDMTAPPEPSPIPSNASPMSPVPSYLSQYPESTHSPPILSPIPFDHSFNQVPEYSNHHQTSDPSWVPISSSNQYSNPTRTPISSPIQFTRSQESPDPAKVSSNSSSLPNASHVEHAPRHSNVSYQNYTMPSTNPNSTAPYSLSNTTYHSNNSLAQFNPNNYVKILPNSSVPNYMSSTPNSSLPAYSNPSPYSHGSSYVTTGSGLGPSVMHSSQTGSTPSSTAPDIQALTGGSGPPHYGYAPRYHASVLQPTHLLADLQNRTVAKDKQKVNVQDFENDTSSPFDNVELKSINDIEELRHVLEQTVLIQQQLKQQHEANLQQMQHHQDQQGLQQFHHQQSLQQDHHASHSSQYAPHYGYEHPPPSHHYKSTQTPHPHPSYIPPSQGQTYPPPLPPGTSHNESPPFHNLTHQGGVGPSHPINPAFISHGRQNFPPYPPSQPHAPPQSNAMPPPTIPPVSEHQQNNAYSQNSSREPSDRSLREGCDVPRVPSILSQLRDELKRKQEERQSPPEISSPQPSGATTPSVCDTPQQIPPTPPSVQMSHLHNPYLSLPASSQSLVDQITEMGFLQSRTARACAEFGPHQEKIIEFLIRVLSLEEQFPSLSGT
ncbi:hypothetical protein WDU94_010636 [Cyamophila willieti]